MRNEDGTMAQATARQTGSHPYPASVPPNPAPWETAIKCREHSKRQFTAWVGYGDSPFVCVVHESCIQGN